MIKLYENYYFDENTGNFYYDPKLDKVSSLGYSELMLVRALMDSSKIFIPKNELQDIIQCPKDNLRTYKSRANKQFNAGRGANDPFYGIAYSTELGFAICLPGKELGVKESQFPLISNCPEPTGKFFGRKNEFDEIDLCFLGNDKMKIFPADALFLTGISGIGKSELAKQYARNCLRNNVYDSVIYAIYEGSLCEMIKTIPVEGVVDKWKNKLSALGRICDEFNRNNKTLLLVIDNFNVTDDTLSENDNEKECWKQILCLSCNKLITSAVVWDNHKYLYIDKLSQDDELRLFKAHLGEPFPYPDSELNAIKTLLKEVDGHTLAIELLAKSLRYMWKKESTTPSQFLKTLQDSGIIGISVYDVTIYKDEAKKTDKPSEIIRWLFHTQVEELKQRSDSFAMNFLYCAALLPVSGISKTLSDELFVDYNPEIIDEMNNRGWIKFEGLGKETIVRMHPLIAEIILTEVSVIAEKHNDIFGKFIDNMLNSINRWKGVFENNELPEQMNSPFEQWIRITDRIVDNNIRCQRFIVLYSELREFAVFYLNAFLDWHGYPLYILSLEHNISSPRSLETYKRFFHNRVILHGTINLSEENILADDDKTNDLENIIFHEWQFSTPIGFRFGKEALDSLNRVMCLNDADNSQIDNEEAEALSACSFDTYDLMLEKISTEYEKNKPRWLKRYMINELTGEKIHISEEILDAAWNWRIGHDLTLCDDSSEKLIRAEALLLDSLKIIRKQENWAYLPRLEIWNLDALSNLYIKIEKYDEGLSACYGMLEWLDKISLNNFRDYGKTYLKIAYIQEKTEDPKIIDTLLEAYNHKSQYDLPEKYRGFYRYNYYAFMIRNFLCHAYKDNHEKAQHYFDEAVSFPIKTLFQIEMFGILRMNASNPIKLLLDNWDDWFEQMIQINPTETVKLTEVIKYLLEFRGLKAKFPPNIHHEEIRITFWD